MREAEFDAVSCEESLSCRVSSGNLLLVGGHGGILQSDVGPEQPATGSRLGHTAHFIPGLNSEPNCNFWISQNRFQ